MRLRRHPIKTRAVLWHGVQNGSRVVRELVFTPGSHYNHVCELRDVHTGLREANITVRVRGLALTFAGSQNSHVFKANPFTHPKEMFSSPEIERGAAAPSEVIVVEVQLVYADGSIPGDDNLMVRVR